MQTANNLRAIPVTRGPKHHFFGYYGICPWDATGRYLACLESDFHDRPPKRGDKATVGIVELATGRFEPLAQTEAWNLQQGCMLHWLPTAPDRLLVFNDRQGDRFVAVVLDIHSGQRRVLPRPVSGLSHDGRTALSLNYARLKSLRPVVGYAGLPDLFADQLAPEDDGVYAMDTASGDARLIVSYAEVREFLRAYPEAQTHKLWFNHTVINRDDTRFVFVVRWNEPGIEIKQTMLLTANVSGGGLRLVSDLGASHFDWRTAQELFGWITMKEGEHYYLINDVTGEYRLVAPDVLTRNGHCSFTRDGRWLLTDTGPDEHHLRALLLWPWEGEQPIVLGRFLSPPAFRGEIRCDLHPRWSRDEHQVCFDSLHEGTRQVYVMDVSGIVGK